MTHSTDSRSCVARTPSSKETLVKDAGFDAVEAGVLEVARFFFQCFAMPGSHAWIDGFEAATSHFDRGSAASVGLDVVATVQAMRRSRTSGFVFNNPRCPGCARILSEHERQFMFAFMAMRQGKPGAARTHAMLLCEGNQSDDFLWRLDRLAKAADAAAPEALRTAAE